ncbi:MAG: O-acetyl-ADP-ribose deacetylase [Crocinitomicaceae bacterium]
MKVRVIFGDITTVSTDAIVNAANSSLLGGGGVDGAIHRKGGPIILEDCRKIRQAQGKCKTGEAVITRGGKLPAKYVIHTVGPVYNEGGEAKELLLANCYKNSIQLLKENELKTIAFPNISTGIYRFPKQRAAEIAVATIDNLTEDMQPDEVLFVCYDEENFTIYKELII